MQATLMRGRVLVIAGSDSGGGAGIQADIKTVTALGGFAATALTAVTVQDTRGVSQIHPIPLGVISGQIGCVLEDIGADCIKIGMLGNIQIIDAVMAALRRSRGDARLVVDPVMIAKGGAALLEDEAVQALRQMVLPHADLITPNLPEAEALTGLTIRSPREMNEAMIALLGLGPKAVLLKGGHLPGNVIIDMYRGPEGAREWHSGRIETRNTHGTGCTLASGIAVGLAQSMTPMDAIGRARAYVRRAIETAPDLGHGHGPLNHAHTIRTFEE